MIRRLFFGCAAVISMGIVGCGGGGGSSSPAVVSANGSDAVLFHPGQMTRTGTVHFNQLPVAVLTIQDDSGNILTPINPPENALEGEKVRFTFADAQTVPSFFRPLPEPIVLFDFFGL
jgi:hypothetical protein